MLIVSPSRRLEDSDAPSPEARASRSARRAVSSLDISSQGSLVNMFSFSVGRSARTVSVQSVWFCSNLLRMLACNQYMYRSVGSDGTYLSFAMSSRCERCLASDILLTTYWPTKYVPLTTAAPNAMRLRFRLSQRPALANIVIHKAIWSGAGLGT